MFQIIKILKLERLLRFQTSFFTYPFNDYFKGFEKVTAVRRIFGKDTEEILENLRIEFNHLGGYMGVNGSNCNIIVNPKYLKNGDKLDLYLDVIHELVHVRQCMQGIELFNPNYSYVQRPTEVEAYRHTVEEARRLKLSDARICEYLKTPWMNVEELLQLAKTLNVQCKP